MNRLTMLLGGCALALLPILAGAADAPDLPQMPEAAKPYLKIERPAVPDSLKAIFDEEKQGAYIPRIKAVDKLGKRLGEDSVAAILWYLHRRVEEDTLAPLQFNAIKNNLCNVLLKQEPKPPAVFGLHLVAMFYDRTYDMVWRDYCLQFLGKWYPQAAEGEERQVIAKALWDATVEDDSGLAGTALLALGNIADRPEIGRQKVMDAALQVATGEKTADLSRITAIQVCVRLGDKRILGPAREMAVSAKSAMVRVSAVGAIGMLGEASDTALLEGLAAKGDSRIVTAAKAAIKRLK